MVKIGVPEMQRTEVTVKRRGRDGRVEKGSRSITIFGEVDVELLRDMIVSMVKIELATGRLKA